MFDLVQSLTMYKMESQKIVNLLNDTDNKSSKFEAGKWYLINDQNNTKYCEENEKDSSIRYSDPYILVTGDITVATIGADTKAVTRINDEHIDTVENLDIIVHM